MGQDHDFVKKHIIGHRKSRMEWTDYREKYLEPAEQEMLAEILRECRVNGFFNPNIVTDKVVFAQMVKTVIRHKGMARHKTYKWPLTVADMRAKSDVYNG